MKTFARLEAALIWMWTSVAVLFLPYIFSLPISLSPGSDFYGHLYANSSSVCPLLPRVSEDSYLKLRINAVCSSQGQSSSSPSPNSPCQALTRLFPKLCNLSSSDDPTLSSTRSKVNGSVDLIKVNALGLENFCVKLVEAYQNVSRSSPDEWISPFQTGGSGDKTACEGSCKNTKIKELQEDEKFDVSPECILLLEGYRIYQEAKSSETISVKVSPSSPRPEAKLSPVPDSEVKPRISVDVGNKSSKLGVAQDKPGEALSQSLTKVTVHSREGVADNPKPTEGPIGPGSASEKLEGSEVKPSPDKRTEVEASESKPTDNKTSDSSKTGLASRGKPLGLQPVSSSTSSSSSSTTSTTTTAASIDTNNEDGPQPPIEAAGDSGKAKSSTSASVPIPQAEKKPEAVGEVGKPKEEVKPPEEEKTGLEVVDDTKDEKSKKLPSSSTKKVVADGGEDDTPLDIPDDVYGDSREIDDGVDKKPPTKLEIERPDVVANANVDGSKNNVFVSHSNQPSKTQSQDLGGDIGNEVSANRYGMPRMPMPYDGRGTTINVSLNESEDTGFFNYFLFCATLAGLMYVVFHNKKKLIAYVVEGRRPARSRSRRPSANSQYRRLEQNFD